MSLHSQTCLLQSPLGNGKVAVTRYIQGGRYIQVNFVENIRQLKILGSCPVTVVSRVTAIYRAVINRFDCSRFCHVLVQVDLALDKIMGRLAHNTKRVTKSRYRKREKECILQIADIVCRVVLLPSMFLDNSSP